MRVFMFPGQSSASMKMLERAAALGSLDEVRAQVDAVLGAAFSLRFFGAEPFVPRCNHDVQLGVFVANHLHWLALQRAECVSDWSLGLSLGEFNHLVDIGALSFCEVLKLVDQRGRLYDSGPSGVMVAVNGVVEKTIGEVLESVCGRVQVSNYNGPSQHVLAGERQDVEEVVRVLEDDHFAMTTEIESRIPMHCELFEPVARQFEACLREPAWQRPTKPYFPNVTGVPIANPQPGDFIRLLTRHVHQPVQWARSNEWLQANVDHPTLVEVGPGSVLSNLARRSWPSVPLYRTEGHPPRRHIELLAARVLHAA